MSASTARVAAAHDGTGPAPSLTVSGLVAGYPGVPVLRGVDLEVPAGMLLAVLGGSGCGKTTLLRAIAGFHPVEAGTIRLDGRLVAGDRTDVAPQRRRVGLVPQEGALFGHLSVAANVGFGLPRGTRRGPRVAEMLKLVGLDRHHDRMPAELSGGQQQRVALARALAPAPALVLLDEPFTALDAGLRAEVREQVRGALRAAGASAVLVTHDQQEALGAADLVAVLRDGCVVQVASPRTLYAQPVDIGVGTFVGEAVLLPASAQHGRAATVLGTVDVAGDGSGHGQVLLRPEQVLLDADAPVRAVVSAVVFHGHDSTVVLDLDGLAVRCRTTGEPTPAVGQTVGVRLAGMARFFAVEAG